MNEKIVSIQGVGEMTGGAAKGAASPRPARLRAAPGPAPITPPKRGGGFIGAGLADAAHGAWGASAGDRRTGDEGAAGDGPTPAPNAQSGIDQGGNGQGGARRSARGASLASPPNPPLNATPRRAIPLTPAPLAFPPLTPAELEARFAEAGATLLALPASGYTPKLRLSHWPVPPEALQVYAGAVRCRPPVPSPERISRMEETFALLALIPEERRLLRRIVALRALVHPISERPLYSWRRLGALFGADHKAIQRWHAEALALLATTLARMAA